MTVSDVAIGNGNAVGNALEGPNAQVRARARANAASVPTTDGDVHTGVQVPAAARRVGWLAVSAGRGVAEDFAAAWPWRGQAPSVLDHLAARPMRHRVGGDGRVSDVAYGMWVGWHFGPALAVIAALSVVMWVVQHPLRALPAAAVVGLLVALWI